MKVLKKNGVELAVLRPQDPEKAIEMGLALVGLPFEAGQKALNEMLNAQPYTFVGLAGDSGGGPVPLLDPDDRNKIVGETRPGDSFVSWSELKANATLVKP